MAEAGKKIKDLSVADTLNDTDELVIEDKTPKTKRTTLKKLYDWFEVKVLSAVKTTTDAMQKTIDSMQKTVNTIQSKIGSDPTPGYFPTYKLDNHGIGFSFINPGGSAVVRATIDGSTKYDVMPNNKASEGNYKIVDVVPSIVDSGWRLTFKIFVDGTIYSRYVDLK